jgi:hypothetical protein
VIDPKRPIGRIERRVLARAVGVLVVLMLVLLPTVTESWCDGAYERWRISDDYRGGGCAQITPAWHRIFPWNWDGDNEIVCLGMCINVPMWTPDP